MVWQIGGPEAVGIIVYFVPMIISVATHSTIICATTVVVLSVAIIAVLSMQFIRARLQQSEMHSLHFGTALTKSQRTYTSWQVYK